ncbi:MAG: glycosyl transferase, partial [Dehalococcoidia bacterium]|nr:glycosyl transferase [Dehalococcoidia bacterium]
MSESPRPTISLCMIVKNEERDLPRCLRSAAPWVDEIIVVDTGSTDRTVSIAQSFGARIEHFSW